MSKTIKNCYYKELTFLNLLKAHERASLGKRNKKELLLFEMNLEDNLVSIYDELYNLTYHSSRYREFVIYEPKERIIRALPYRDRIVHQWVVESFIKPYIRPKFIKDSYACIIDGGTHMAVKNLQKYMRKMRNKYGQYYILKCDISKYFNSIDKKILYNILKKHISDKCLLTILNNIVFDNDFSGIPIGNYTSQYFANIYLNEFDHYVKEVLRVKYYVRYMDDFVFLLKDKDECKKVYNLIAKYLADYLHLNLNRKTKYFPSRFGCDFCGYVIYEDFMLIRKRSKDKLRKKIKKWRHLKAKERLNCDDVRLSFNSWVGYAMHADTYHLISKYADYLDEIL